MSWRALNSNWYIVLNGECSDGVCNFLGLFRRNVFYKVSKTVLSWTVQLPTANGTILSHPSSSLQYLSVKVTGEALFKVGVAFFAWDSAQAFMPVLIPFSFQSWLHGLQRLLYYDLFSHRIFLGKLSGRTYTCSIVIEYITDILRNSIKSWRTHGRWSKFILNIQTPGHL